MSNERKPKIVKFEFDDRSLVTGDEVPTAICAACGKSLTFCTCGEPGTIKVAAFGMDAYSEREKKMLERQQYLEGVVSQLQARLEVACHVKADDKVGFDWAVLDELQKAREAIAGILAEPHGCPMCDSGVLRNPEKQHWPDCPYAIARAVIGR